MALLLAVVVVGKVGAPNYSCPVFFSAITMPAVSCFDQWAPLAIRMQEKTGVPASIVLAQAYLESIFGASDLARETNNWFGIKCRRGCEKPGHCKEKSDDHPDDRFLCFASVECSFEKHATMLCKGRYIRLRYDLKDDWQSWCDALQKKGYATNKHYSKHLKRIIKKYRLYEYQNATEQSFDPADWLFGCD